MECLPDTTDTVLGTDDGTLGGHLRTLPLRTP